MLEDHGQDDQVTKLRMPKWVMGKTTAAWLPSLLSFPESALFQNKNFLPFCVKANASMKVTPKMAATLPDSNDVDEAIPLDHPTKKSSARKSKIKV